ncbi:MAG: hypothetical protein Q8O62_10005 [Aequorivita sp.]|nr:hypothetical protein [Aequorivita sp.]
MKNLPQLPAHYLDNRPQPDPQTDTKTKEMLRGAIADIDFHNRYNAEKQWGKKQVKKELNLYYKQQEALDGPKAETLTVDEKKRLRSYYKEQIRRRLIRLDILINGKQTTANAINCNVVDAQIVS